MGPHVPTLRATNEINIWQMAFRLTLLATFLMTVGIGFLFAVKSVIKLFM